MPRVFLFLICCLLNCTLPASAEPRIFAAASLRGGLEAALNQSGHTASVSYGGSGAIARQVALGAPADLVLLAHPDWDEWLSDRLVLDGKSTTLLENRLVLVGPAGSVPFASQPTVSDLTARLGEGRLAMGQRDTVPAGQYARAWLRHIGAWQAIESRVAEAANVRAALAFVARGEAPLALVYATDALAEERVVVLWNIAPDTHPQITYTARALSEQGQDLLGRLRSCAAQNAFSDHGFLPFSDLDNQC